MVLENGEKVVLFKPLEPYETPDAIKRILGHSLDKRSVLFCYFFSCKNSVRIFKSSVKMLLKADDIVST